MAEYVRGQGVVRPREGRVIARVRRIGATLQTVAVDSPG
jgi:hypothetical protein